MKVQDSIPLFDLPLGQDIRGKDVAWFGTDTLSNYRSQAPTPAYGEKDICYRFNRHGYRSPEFDLGADIRMLSIGCEPAFGVGVPQEQIFHEALAKRLESERSRQVINWNLSAPDASNDYICRVLLLALPQLNPDLVVVQFAPLARREYFTVLNARFAFIPEAPPPDPVGKEIHGHFAALSNTHDDCLNFFRNYKAIEALLRRRSSLFTLPVSLEDLGAAAAHVSRERLVGTWPRLDTGRDGTSPGPRSQQACLEAFWDKLTQGGFLTPE